MLTSVDFNDDAEVWKQYAEYFHNCIANVETEEIIKKFCTKYNGNDQGDALRSLLNCKNVIGDK